MVPLFKVLMAPQVPGEIERVIASGVVTQGPRVDQFEGQLAALMGVPVLTLNSGTSALHLAATLIDLQPGDEVISTPITCAATNVALARAGARIAWADVDPFTGLIDPSSVAAVAAKLQRPRAVMAVDWGGALCAFEALRLTTGLPVIEDAAHAFGAARSSYPDFTCWSFQAIKHLTTADGGGLYVALPALRERARRLRWFGIDRDAPGANIEKAIEEPGFKYHMNDLNAAIGLANLPAAKVAVERHRANAAWYNQELSGISGIRVPPSDPTSAWWLYTILLEPDDQQQRFIEFMKDRGIACSRVHSRNDTHPAFSGAVTKVPLPGVTYFDTHQVAIPVGWWVTEEDRARIADAVVAWSHS